MPSSGRDSAHRDWYVWRDRAARRLAAQQLGGRLRPVRAGLDLRPAVRPVVPPPVRAGPTRPQLGRARPWSRPCTSVLRFWLDRGVDGFRADVIHCIGKDPDLPDDPPAGGRYPPQRPQRRAGHPPAAPGHPGAGRRLSRGPGHGRRGLPAVAPRPWPPTTGTATSSTWPSTSRPCSPGGRPGAWTECIEQTVAALDPAGRLAHLGALQPRQSPPPHPLRPGRRPAGGGRRRPRPAGARPGPGRPPCCS